MSTTKTLAFFGATGDCAGHCLANSLKGGFKCTALARTPSKLTASMKTKGVDSTVLDNNLTIIQGDVRDLETVKRTLQRPDGQGICDVIVVGIGAYPTLQWSFANPIVQQDPTICQDANTTILKALVALRSPTKPIMINVSTTGIPPKGKPWDVPWVFSWFYHVLLHNAHVDKIVREENLAEHLGLPEKDRVVGGYINVKPPLLQDGEAKGVETMRESDEDAPVIGYFMRRSDVGLWMYERCVKVDPQSQWMNKGVTICYQ